MRDRRDAPIGLGPMELDDVTGGEDSVTRRRALNDHEAALGGQFVEATEEPQLLDVVVEDSEAPNEVETPELGAFVLAQIEDVRLDVARCRNLREPRRDLA